MTVSDEDKGLLYDKLRTFHFSEDTLRKVFEFSIELYMQERRISPESMQNIVTLKAKPQEYQALMDTLGEALMQPISLNPHEQLCEDLNDAYKQRTVYNQVFMVANRMFMNNDPLDAVTDQIQSALMALDNDTNEVSLSEAVRTAEQMITNPNEEDQGELIGLTDWDEQFGGVKPDRVYTFAGFSGSGKTAKVIDMICRLCLRHQYHLRKDGIRNSDGTLWDYERGEKIAIQFFSLEMSEVRIVLRLISWITGITEHVLTNQNRKKANGDFLVPQLTEAELNRVLDATRLIRSWPLDIVYTSLNASAIRTKSKKFSLKNKAKRKYWFLDHLGEVDNPDGKDNRIQFDLVMSVCKSLARDHKGSVFPLVQLSKATEQGKDAEKRFYRPDQGHIMESIGVQAKSDILVLQWRPAKRWRVIAYDNENEWVCTDKIIDIVVKNRDGQAGNDIVYGCQIQFNRLRDNADF